MVREARFSWDDLDGSDPSLRHERPDDFDGPDDDWVEDLKPAARRRKRRTRRRAAERKPPVGPSVPSSRTAGPLRDSPAAEPRRHLADADWLGPQPHGSPPGRPPQPGPAFRAETGEPRAPHSDQRTAERSQPPFPGDPAEHPDDAA